MNFQEYFFFFEIPPTSHFLTNVSLLFIFPRCIIHFPLKPLNPQPSYLNVAVSQSQHTLCLFFTLLYSVAFVSIPFHKISMSWCFCQFIPSLCHFFSLPCNLLLFSLPFDTSAMLINCC